MLRALQLPGNMHTRTGAAWIGDFSAGPVQHDKESGDHHRDHGRRLHYGQQGLDISISGSSGAGSSHMEYISDGHAQEPLGGQHAKSDCGIGWCAHEVS